MSHVLNIPANPCSSLANLNCYVVELSLFQATFLFGIALLLLGGSFLLKYKPASALARSFPRSKQAGIVLMILAMAWTGWRVAHLGAADYGNFKQYILIGFGLLGVLSFRYASDFLSVRASTILFLLAADELLGGAWMRYDQSSRLFMVVPVYLGIALSLYLAYAPFRVRDFFGWLFANDGRAKKFAGVLAVYGLLVSVIAFAY